MFQTQNVRIKYHTLKQGKKTPFESVCIIEDEVLYVLPIEYMMRMYMYYHRVGNLL